MIEEGKERKKNVEQHSFYAISIHGERMDIERAYFMTDDTFWSLGVQLH